MVIAAMICTILAGFVGGFIQPVSLGVSLPIAVMGGFILAHLNDLNREKRKDAGSADNTDDPDGTGGAGS